MKVSLGTITIDDDTRKAVRRLKGGKGLATRGEVKDYLLERLDNTVVASLTAQPEATGVPQGPADAGDEYGADLPLTTYQPDEQGVGGLPEPTAERGDAVT